MHKEDWIAICRENLRHKDRIIGGLETELVALSGKLDFMEKDHAERQDAQQAAHNAEVSELQESVFRNISETRWPPMNDTTVSHELESLQNTIARFSKSYAIEGTQGSKAWSEERLADLSTALRKNDVSAASEQALLRILEMRYGPRLCLNGLLSAAVHMAVFVNPFFFLVDSSNLPTPAEVFEDFFKRASVGKSAAAIARGNKELR